MSRIVPARWPLDFTNQERDAFERIWDREIGGSIWHNDYTTALVAHDQARIVAACWYLRTRPHLVTFARIVRPSHRGQGFANQLLDRLLQRCVGCAFTCDNVNPHLTASLIARGFVNRQGKMMYRPACKILWRRRAA